MKILHVIHSVDPRSGGPSHALRSLARAQVELGHDVTILGTTIQSSEPWLDSRQYALQMRNDEAFTASELVLLQAWGRRKPWATIAYCPAATGWFRKRLASPAPPDIVHIHGVFSHLTTVAARIARKSGVPYLLRTAGSLNQACFSSGMARGKRWFVRNWLADDLHGAAAVHATSSAECRELARHVSPDRIVIVPNGADLPTGNADTERVAFLDRFPHLRGREIVLFLSRLVTKKRPDVLVDAVAKLLSSHPDVALVFVGQDCGFADNVREAISRNGIEHAVTWTGFLQGELKHGAFHAASVFALPSIDENFGIAVVDALAHGLPVVTTPGVAAHLYVDQARAGITTRGTPDDFAAALGSMLDGDRAAMSRRGRELVKRDLSWTAIAKRLESTYLQSQTPSANSARAA